MTVDEMQAEAERLGVPFVCMDERTIPESVKWSALRTQAAAFADLLAGLGVRVGRVTECGEVELPGLNVRIPTTVSTLRATLRRAGGANQQWVWLLMDEVLGLGVYR
jgi:hypothetical protein